MLKRYLVAAAGVAGAVVVTAAAVRYVRRHHAHTAGASLESDDELSKPEGGTSQVHLRLDLSAVTTTPWCLSADDASSDSGNESDELEALTERSPLPVLLESLHMAATNNGRATQAAYIALSHTCSGKANCVLRDASNMVLQFSKLWRRFVKHGADRIVPLLC